MAIYFSTRQIPKLSGKPLTERLAAMQMAEKKLTVPEKTLLNVLKLLVIIPIFVLVLQVTSNWTFMFWALLVFLLYPLAIKPIQYSLCAKYLPQEISKEN